MIVQLAEDKQSAFVIRQQDHAEVSGVFAEHFGNDVFQSLHPETPVIHVTRHHDDGWEAIDNNPRLDPDTDYPYHLTQTPMELLLATGNASPDANESFHPYSGILSSMHTYGLYHGRYGLSDKIFIDMVSDDWRQSLQSMLSIELDRQERLKEDLREQGQEDIVTEQVLFQNYKLLQFFDTLALYIQTIAPEQVGESEFLNVPKNTSADVSVIARCISIGVVTLDPWVFGIDEFTVHTKGRVMTPVPDQDALNQAFQPTPVITQTYTFRRA